MLIVPSLCFGGTCALYLAVVRPLGAHPIGVATFFVMRVLFGAIIAAALVRGFPDGLATFRYVSGLYLIAAAIIGIRRATTPGQIRTDAQAEATWTRRLGLGQVLFGFALLTHVVEGPDGVLVTMLSGGLAAWMLGSLTLLAIATLEKAQPDTVLADRRIRQGLGVVLLAVAVYLAWP